MGDNLCEGFRVLSKPKKPPKILIFQLFHGINPDFIRKRAAAFWGWSWLTSTPPPPPHPTPPGDFFGV